MNVSHFKWQFWTHSTSIQIIKWINNYIFGILDKWLHTRVCRCLYPAKWNVPPSWCSPCWFSSGVYSHGTTSRVVSSIHWGWEYDPSVQTVLCHMVWFLYYIWRAHPNTPVVPLQCLEFGISHIHSCLFLPWVQ